MFSRVFLPFRPNSFRFQRYTGYVLRALTHPTRVSVSLSCRCSTPDPCVAPRRVASPRCRSCRACRACRSRSSSSCRFRAQRNKRQMARPALLGGGGGVTAAVPRGCGWAGGAARVDAPSQEQTLAVRRVRPGNYLHCITRGCK